MPDLKVRCPNCSLDAQHVGMNCTWCHSFVPVPGATVAPDGTVRVEEIIGWKGWHVTHNKMDEVRICSPMFPVVWEPGEWVVAECRGSGKGLSPDNPKYHGPDAADPKKWSPVKGCGGQGHGCGFYAGRTRGHLIQLGYNRSPNVMGEVQLAGKIIPASNGWRAQKCYPRSILVPFEQWELCNDLQAVYGPHGVDVQLAATAVMPKGTREWCEKCSAAMTRSPICPLCQHAHID